MDGFIERFSFKVIQIHLFSTYIFLSSYKDVFFLAGDEINI